MAVGGRNGGGGGAGGLEKEEQQMILIQFQHKRSSQLQLRRCRSLTTGGGRLVLLVQVSVVQEVIQHFLQLHQMAVVLEVQGLCTGVMVSGGSGGGNAGGTNNQANGSGNTPRSLQTVVMVQVELWSRWRTGAGGGGGSHKQQTVQPLVVTGL